MSVGGGGGGGGGGVGGREGWTGGGEGGGGMGMDFVTSFGLICHSGEGI